MAGGFGSKFDPKNKRSVKKNNSEILKEFSDISQVKSEPKLFGRLFPGQSIHLNQEKQPNKDIDWNREFLTKTATEAQPLFVNQHHQEIQQAINEILDEIKKLKLSTDNLTHEIDQASEQNIPEANEYQLKFLQRIKNIIIQFRQNIDQSCVWMECFNRKRSRKNAFWGNVRNKKNGGEQYLFSGEHSASRSAN
jgi:hypothetical protein